MPKKTDEIRNALSAYYRARRGSGQLVEIADVAPLEGGRQHEMYSFNLVEGKGMKTHVQPSVLRLYDGATAGENAEYECKVIPHRRALTLRAAKGLCPFGIPESGNPVPRAQGVIGNKIMENIGPSDVPVPKVFVLERDDKYLGRPFIVMEKVEGEDLDSFASRIVQADPSGLASKEVLMWISKLAALLASVHELDWRAFGLGFLKPYWRSVDSMLDLLDSAEAEYMASRYGDLRQLFNWLRTAAKEAANPEVVLLHYDFHPYNVMVRRGKIVAVLDWCEACPGDAALDVGWVDLKLHEGDVAGETIDAFVTEYKRHSGRELNNLTFFEVVAGCRQLYDLLALREGKALELNKRSDAGALYDVNAEIAKTASFIYQRTGVDISSI